MTSFKIKGINLPKQKGKQYIQKRLTDRKTEKKIMQKLIGQQ